MLREVDHPAVPLLLEYKELARLHAAHGWAWLDAWVAGGRFRPEYVVGGVVSGRWATSGGGALQIPRVLRRAVIADPGWVLVVADAAQLEPRVLAALAGDRAFAEAAAAGDLYSALAGAFGGDRAKAKVALLSAMYGGAGGEAGQLLAVLRRRFPLAAQYVEAAARAGEEGRVVRSLLGRTCPPPSAAWRGLTAAPGAGGGRPRRAGRCAPAAGSPGTSSCRPARPTGRWCCSRACGRGWPRWRPGPAAGGRAAPGLLPARRGDRALPGGARRAGGRGDRRRGRGGRAAGVRGHAGALPGDDRRGRLLRRREVVLARRPGRGQAAVGAGCSVPQYLHLEAAAGRSADRQAGQVLTGGGSPNAPAAPPLDGLVRHDDGEVDDRMKMTK